MKSNEEILENITGYINISKMTERQKINHTVTISDVLLAMQQAAEQAKFQFPTDKEIKEQAETYNASIVFISAINWLKSKIS